MEIMHMYCMPLEYMFALITNNSEYYVSFVKTGSRESHQFQPLVAAVATSTVKGISIVTGVITNKAVLSKN